MRYSFRPNLFQKHLGLALSEEQLHLIDRQAQVIRRYDFRDIKSIHKLRCGSVEDSAKGKCNLDQFTIRFHSHWPITVKSASYTGPGTGVDHGPDYRRFLSQLIGKLARSNPDVTITEGSQGLVYTWKVLRIAFCLITLMGIGVILNSLLSADWSRGSIFLAISCLAFGICGMRIAGALTQMYRPRTASVSEAHAE